MAPRRSWAKANPCWSLHVHSWYCGDQDAEEYCGRRKLSMATFERWVRHLVSPEDLCKTDRNAAEFCAARRQNVSARSGRRSGARGPRAIAIRAHELRSDRASSVLSMHLEAMNWSGMGMPSMPRRLGLSPIRCGSGAIVSKTPARRQPGDCCVIRVPGLNQAALLIARDPNAGSGGRSVEPASVQQQAEAGDRAADGEARRQRGAGLPQPWRRYQHGVLLAGRVRPDRPQGAATPRR